MEKKYYDAQPFLLDLIESSIEQFLKENPITESDCAKVFSNEKNWPLFPFLDAYTDFCSVVDCLQVLALKIQDSIEIEFINDKIKRAFYWECKFSESFDGCVGRHRILHMAAMSLLLPCESNKVLNDIENKGN